MSHRARVIEGFRSLSLPLFVGAFAITLAQALAGVGWGVAVATVDPPLTLLLGPTIGIVTSLLALPLYVGLYGVVREGLDLPDAVTFTVRHYRDVLVADALAYGVALLAGLGGATLVYVAHTSVRLVEYVGGRTTPPPFQPVLYLAGAAAILAFWLGFLATRFADVLVVFEDRSPRSAWADSLRFVRRRPGAFAGYAVVLTILLAWPQVFSYMLADPLTLDQLVGTVAVVAVFEGVGLALAAAVHVSYFDGSVRSALAGERFDVPVRRIALATVVIVAAIAGAAVVRTADVAVSGAEPEPLPNDAAEAADVAIANTVEASRRQVTTVQNESGDGAVRRSEVTAMDYEDRQLRIKLYGDDGEYVGGYLGEGILANHVIANGTVPAEEWYRYHVPGYGVAVGGGATETPLEEGDWRLVDETDETLTYRIDESNGMDEILTSGRQGTRGGLAEGSRATLVVDRSAGVIERVTYHLRSRETDNAYTYVERYEDVGAFDYERPDALGPRHPLEWLWDALYY